MTETKAASTDVAPTQPAIFTHFDRPIEYLSDALHYGGFCGLGEFCFLDRDIDINMLCTAIADTSETEGLSEEGLNKAKEAHAMLSLVALLLCCCTSCTFVYPWTSRSFPCTAPSVPRSKVCAVDSL
jgi:hypothetical protein